MGNDQYDYKELREDLGRRYEQLCGNRGVFDGQIAEDKKVLEPMALPPERENQTIGSVLVGGPAQKGMLRHSLGALFSAPMERVWERTFSYRLNATFVGKERTCRPALVIDGGGKAKDGTLRPITVLLLQLQDLCYVHPTAFNKMPRRFRDLAEPSPNDRQKHYKTASARRSIAVDSPDIGEMENARLRLTRANILKTEGRQENLSKLQGRVPVVNFNGIDLAVRLNRIFHDRNPDPRQLRNKSRGGYPMLLVRLPGHANMETLGTRQLKEFDKSLEHLSGSAHGHLRDHPLLHDRSDHESLVKELQKLRKRGLLPGDLIFL